MTIRATSPYDFFPDAQGAALTNGTVYIGESGKNPVTNPIAVTWESSSATAAQPISVMAGVFYNSGTPDNINVGVLTFSVSVYDKSGTLVYSNLNAKTHQDSNTLNYLYGTDAATASHSGLTTGDIIHTTYRDNNLIAGSGSDARFTGTTTVANAGKWFGDATDGYGYDADGKQFAIEGSLTPVKFGALADKTTDDSRALAAMAIAAKNEGMKIDLLGKSYLVLTRVDFDSVDVSNGTIYGYISVQGEFSLTKVNVQISDADVPSYSGENMITLSGAVSNASILGCSFSMLSTTAPVNINSAAICYFSGQAINGLTIRDNYLTVPSSEQCGIYVVPVPGTADLSNLHIEDNKFSSIGRMGIVIQGYGGDTSVGQKDIWITGNKIYNTGTVDTTLTGMGISIAGNTRTCVIIDNIFDTIYGYGIEYTTDVGGIVGLIISDNRFINCTHNHLINSSSGVNYANTISGNHFDSGGTAGVGIIINNDQSIIEKNTFVNFNSYIGLSGKENIIADNNFYNASSAYQVLLTGATYNIIKGNVVAPDVPKAEFIRLNGSGTSGNIATQNVVTLSGSHLFGTSGAPSPVNDFTDALTNIEDKNFILTGSGIKTTSQYATTAFNPGTISTGLSVISSAIALDYSTTPRYIEVYAPYDLSGCTATAYVVPNASAKIVVSNNTGADVTLASGVWIIKATSY